MTSKHPAQLFTRVLQSQARAQTCRQTQYIRPLSSLVAKPSRTPSLTTQQPHLHLNRPYHTTSSLRKEDPATAPTTLSPSTLYNYSDLVEFTTTPSASRIIIDVREPSELLDSGTIPSSRNVPISSAPDAFFLSAEDFEDKFGWERPGKDSEVVFFCKAGVRSRTAAKLAQQAGFGGKVGEYPGSWLDWVGNGGKVQKM